MYKDLLMRMDLEIQKICKEQEEKLTTEGQYQLHLLLENKHALYKMYGEAGT